MPKAAIVFQYCGLQPVIPLEVKNQCRRWNIEQDRELVSRPCFYTQSHIISFCEPTIYYFITRGEQHARLLPKNKQSE